MERIESISILWGKRKEAIEVLSEKLFNSLDYISKSLPDIYSDWYMKGNSLSEALKNKIIINKDNLKKILETSVDKKFPDLGMRISLWNGMQGDDKRASFSTKLGLYTDNKNLKNNFVLDFPEQSNFNMEDIRELIDFLYTTFEGEQIRINGNPIEIL